MRSAPALRLVAALFVVASCGEPSAPRRPASIAVVTGANQTAAVASPLPQPVVVEVKDASGRALSGVNVTWTVAQGGGSVSSANGATDAGGRAQVQWTLGTTSGSQRLTAAVNGVAPAAITATGTPGAPAGIAIVSGSEQTGTAGMPLPLPIVARVADQHGNGVPGAAVAFSASAGVAQPASVETNATGHAITSWTLGADPGAHTLDAGLTGTASSVRYTATAVPPPVVVVLENDVPVTGLAAADKVDYAYRISVPASAVRLRVTLSGGSGDADLYVQRGQLATLQQHDCRSTSPTTTETCDVQSPGEGDWYILVHAWSAYSGVTLRATYTVGGSMAVSVGGLPAGANAGIAVSGPDGFARTVDASTNLQGLAPGTYTVFAPNVVSSGVVYNATPGTQGVSIAGGAAVTASITYAQSTGGLNLDIPRVHITQSVQRPDNSVPLIADREALVRVHARASAVNSVTPTVRLRIYHGGALVDTRTIAAPAAAVPVVTDDAQYNSTWNVRLPASLIRPGLAILADVDPTNSISETQEDDNTYPADGAPLPLTVRTASAIQARFVPVLQVPNGLLGDVTASNVGSYTSTAQAMFPIPGIDADVRAPYNFSAALPSQYDSVWVRLLTEIALLRTADGSTRQYYGVIKPAYTSGGAGLGYIGLPAAIGVEWPTWRAETVAHEWGHNFGRLHVACGNPANPDPNYPYTARAGETGHHGWDPRSNALRLRDAHQDVMSYCQPTWISDYTYMAVMDFRGTAAGGAAEPAVIVWGRVSRDGSVLEPAFEVTTLPSLPRAPGPWRVRGFDAAGSEILDLSFEAAAIDHMPDDASFAFAVPVRTLRGRQLAELRLSGPGAYAERRVATTARADAVSVVREDANTVRIRWDAAHSPAVLVRDAATGAVLAVARDGDARVRTSAAEIEINVSDGVRSGARRITVDR